MAEFISEPLEPLAGTFSAGAMACGLPGLPAGFTWRGDRYRVVECVASWKQSGPERGRLHGERYLRRHYSRLRMDDQNLWTVYFERQARPGAAAKKRWFLYSVETSDAPR